MNRNHRFWRGCLIVTFACACLVPSFVHAQATETKSDSNQRAAARAMAILDSGAQWEPLLQGDTLEGWTGDTEGYMVEEGVLICKKGGKNLVTDKEYSDFVFQFEFKLQESGNNGIGIRVPTGGHPASNGMEIQILDHHGERYNGTAEMANGKPRKLSWLKPWQYHGSIYGITPAKIGYLNPVGEWNQETIIAIEDHIMVILNGAVIVDAHLDQTTPVDGGNHPGMKNKSGHLVLAGHSDRVEFRNLQLADYSLPTPTPKTKQDNTPPKSFVSLFNGKDLSGWKGLANKNANARRALKGAAKRDAQTEADKIMQEHWSVNSGVLTYDGSGQSLCTAKDYGDFEMYVDWKIPPGADSGIYLRGTPQIQIWDPWDARVKVGQESPATPEAWVAAYKNGRNLGSGGLWNNKRWRNSPTVLADKSPGEWNTFFIRMVGDKVSIWLNGKRIVDRVALENYWDKTGTVPLPRADQIELQHHGSELFFKNLYIRELPY
ncbi:MAG: 3-keto-disaccharide hydrolase [Rubripirellula sp.]